MKGLRILAVLVALLVSAPAIAQDALSLDAFFGRWEGSAVSQSVEATAIGYGARDLDVEIAGGDDGFEITWVTVIQPSGTETEAQRRSTTQRFVRSGEFIWTAEDSVGPDASGAQIWARLEGRSLIVYVLEIDRTGVYEISRYERAISHSGVMDLKFTRIRDGDTLRRVTGSLRPAAE